MKKYKLCLYAFPGVSAIVNKAAGNVMLAYSKCGINCDVRVKRIEANLFEIVTKHDIYNNLKDELDAAKINYSLFEIGNPLL